MVGRQINPPRYNSPDRDLPSPEYVSAGVCNGCGQDVFLPKKMIVPPTQIPDKTYDGSCSRCGRDNENIKDMGLDQLCPSCLIATTTGYHLAKIEKGQYGEASKIKEEAEELIDSIAQGSKLMALQECSDLYGAIRAYLAKYHPTITMSDLEKMSDITKRAFENGYR